MLPNREQTENGKFSIFRCVLHRSSQNSLFGQVAGPFQEIISQPHREQHFTETHHKITENSLFFSILYFPTWTFTPSKNAIQSLLFLPQLVDNDHKSKGLFFRNKRHRHLVNALEIFSSFSVFLDVKAQPFEFQKFKQKWQTIFLLSLFRFWPTGFFCIR